MVLLESCLQTRITHTIAECTVNKLLMMDRGTIQNVFNLILFSKHALRLSAFPSHFFQTHTPSAAKSILQNVCRSKVTVGRNGKVNKGIQFITKGGIFWVSHRRSWHIRPSVTSRIVTGCTGPDVS